MTNWTKHKVHDLFAVPYVTPQSFPTMPKDYVAFMEEHNGIVFEPSLVLDLESEATKIPSIDADDTVVFSLLYGSCPGELFNIAERQDDNWFSNWNAGSFIAIGGSPSCNNICMSIRPIDFGSVFEWVLATEPPTASDVEKWREHRLSLLAPSFGEFLRRIDLYAITCDI